MSECGQSMTPRTDEVLAIENNYGAYPDGSDGVTQQEAHDEMVSSLAKLSRQLESSLAEAVSALREAQCDCSVRERESGHKVGCWKPGADAILAKHSG